MDKYEKLIELVKERQTQVEKLHGEEAKFEAMLKNNPAARAFVLSEATDSITAMLATIILLDADPLELIRERVQTQRTTY